MTASLILLSILSIHGAQTTSIKEISSQWLHYIWLEKAKLNYLVKLQKYISLFSWDNCDKITSDVIWIKFKILSWQMLDQIGICKLCSWRMETTWLNAHHLVRFWGHSYSFSYILFNLIWVVFCTKSFFVDLLITFETKFYKGCLVSSFGNHFSNKTSIIM